MRSRKRDRQDSQPRARIGAVEEAETAHKVLFCSMEKWPHVSERSAAFSTHLSLKGGGRLASRLISSFSLLLNLHLVNYHTSVDNATK